MYSSRHASLELIKPSLLVWCNISRNAFNYFIHPTYVPSQRRSYHCDKWGRCLTQSSCNSKQFDWINLIIISLSSEWKYRPGLATVLLNYNFISICMDKCDNTRYFACKITKFAVEIKLYTWQVMEFPLDVTKSFHKMWCFHKMWHFHETWLWIYLHEISFCLYGYADQLSCFV